MASKWNILLQEMENVCSQEDRVHCNHDDIEGKGHEDHGGLDENENQTCQIKNASGTTE